MITDALLAVAFALWDGFIMLIDLAPIPLASDATSTLMGDLGLISTHMKSLSYWIPFDLAGAVIVILWGVFNAVIAIRLARVVLSLFTGGGGSAG